MKFCRSPAILGKSDKSRRLRPAAATVAARRGFWIGALVAAACIALQAHAAEQKIIRLATTTSTENSGLLDYLLPEFKRESGYTVHVIAVGTGKALRMGSDGDVDLVLVHARPAEERFVNHGHGIDRRDVMYNDFVIVGPPGDLAGVRQSASAADALARIATGEHMFVSRGDDSGTHKKERRLWDLAGINPAGRWYREAGQGMGKVLQMSSELDAYTLTDRGTWLAMKDKLALELLFEGDEPLHNPYGIIMVNPARHPHTDVAGASALVEWITSERGQRLIDEYRVNGQRLFIPNAATSRADGAAVK
ncbi:MAG: substrate-binding domain-containing protein [Gammaproteobacteria bacterium]|nr:substrate-binding domain-containing protein [Gammaproteobacteria bacterium]